MVLVPIYRIVTTAYDEAWDLRLARMGIGPINVTSRFPSSGQPPSLSTFRSVEGTELACKNWTADMSIRSTKSLQGKEARIEERAEKSERMGEEWNEAKMCQAEAEMDHEEEVRNQTEIGMKASPSPTDRSDEVETKRTKETETSLKVPKETDHGEDEKWKVEETENDTVEKTISRLDDRVPPDGAAVYDDSSPPQPPTPMERLPIMPSVACRRVRSSSFDLPLLTSRLNREMDFVISDPEVPPSQLTPNSLRPDKPLRQPDQHSCYG
ncbi:unnamed protein product, partial [Protopolystoma xenopodis]